MPTLIHEDIISDIAKATAEEDKAIEQHNAFKADSEKTVQDHALGVPPNIRT